VFSSPHWTVFLSWDQLYLGRSIVSLRRHASSLSDLAADEWGDLHDVIRTFEKVCTSTLGAVMFNWTCLMNDAYRSDLPNPHVHLHARPRYAMAPSLDDQVFPDPNFGHHYERSSDVRLGKQLTEKLRTRLSVAYSLAAAARQ
jgi:diadenosine tetraphosphate (Ap4A) HIT family hydrolase